MKGVVEVEIKKTEPYQFLVSAIEDNQAVFEGNELADSRGEGQGVWLLLNEQSGLALALVQLNDLSS